MQTIKQLFIKIKKKYPYAKIYPEIQFDATKNKVYPETVYFTS